MRTRRAVLAGLALAPLAGRVVAQFAAQVDVAIVGAGAAGIAAARALTAAGLSPIVLEARSRVGGRTWTVGGLGQPFDMGAHWLHVAQSNPLVTIAREQGLTLTESDPTGVLLFDEGRQRAAADQDAFAASAARLEKRAILPGRFGPDRAISSLAPDPDQWEALALHVPTIEMAEEPGRVSLRDYLSLGTGPDLVAAGGYGALLAGLAKGLDIRLSSPVTSIRWQDRGGVTLTGSFGSLVARAAIVTLPTALLAAGAVRFSPALPDTLGQALADLPLGVFEKVAFRLDRTRPDLPEYAIATGVHAQGLTHALHLSPDRKVATVILVGDTARDLIAAGRRARIAAARGILADIAGAGQGTEVVLITDWQRDPLARGAYSHARVGAAKARRLYATPLEDRLWFAGEAAPGAHAVTVAGAWISGMAAAREVARVIAG